MRILHVVRQYAPGIGGLETYVAQLARCQQGMGHDVRVLTLDRIFDGDGSRLPAQEIRDGVPVARVKWRGSRRYPLAPAALRCLGDAELVHVHGVDFFVDALAATRWLHRKPMILSTHGGFFHTGFAQRLKRLFFVTVTRWSLAGVHAVLASSVQDREEFGRLWADRTFLVENAVDLDRFAGLARPDGRTMIYFGRIAPNKEVARLLGWFAALHGNDPRWHLIVAGKPMGVAMAALEEDARALGIADAVEFHESPDDAALRALVARSNVYACASSYEGFGLAAVEAVSAGLYPVLSDIPPFRRTLDRIGYGTVVDFGQTPDPERFLAEWRRFIADPPSATSLASKLEPFAWSRVAERIEDITAVVLGHKTRRIGPLDVEVTTRDSALARVLDAVAGRKPLIVAFANAHTVNTARMYPGLVEALRSAMLLNDGVGLNIASRLLYAKRFPHNLNGTDFTPAVLRALPQPSRVFLVGSGPGVAERAGNLLEQQFPNVRIVGTQHGFFAQADEEDLAARIRESGADLVLAAMGNPRQELWAHDNLARIGVPILCVGAFLDYTAGVVRRSPGWARRVKMEWMYRLVQNPRRLGRRYMIGNIVFLYAVTRQWLRGQRGGRLA